MSEHRGQEDEREPEVITLGGGCFWCLEVVFQEMEGVEKVQSGYAGGHFDNPTYRDVCSGETGHAEVVQVTFDPEITSLEEILRVFFTIHDPTTLNRQGADVGTQYRSVVLFHSRQQEWTTREMIKKVEEAGLYRKPVVTEVEWLTRFWPAEEEHDDYYRRNRDKPYCRVVIDPKLKKFRESFPGKRRSAAGG